MKLIEREFIQIVERRMKVLGLTRVELARRMGEAPSYVSNYLNGDKLAGDKVKEKFAEALGITLHLQAEEIAT